MKTSEVARVLQGAVSVRAFCRTYQDRKKRLEERKDGAATSVDLGLQFDAPHMVVTATHVENIRRAVTDGEIDLSDARFFATVILLSAFDFDDPRTEEAAVLISQAD